MDVYSLFLYLSMGAGFFMAVTLGANDVANSMAPCVGSRAITVRQALVIASVLNFVGAVMLGSHVAATMSRGIVSVEMIGDPKLVMLGMFAALLAASLWMLVATLTALPVSSTHSIVGAIIGFGLVAGGPKAVNWLPLGGVVLSWFISPFFALGVAYFIFTQIRKRIFLQRDFLAKAQAWGPRWMALTSVMVGFSFMYKTPFGKRLQLPLWGSTLVVAAFAGAVWLAGRWYTHRLSKRISESVEGVEQLFKNLQIFTASYVALSQGANDVANAIGPIAVIYLMAREHAFVQQAEIPLWLLGLGGLGIALGIMALGHKVMATVGEKITTLTNTRGFSVDFASATTVLVASKLGLPVSSTHAAVGAVTGVGLARGFKAVDFGVLFRIVIYWVITVPVAALTSIFIYLVLKWLFA